MGVAELIEVLLLGQPPSEDQKGREDHEDVNRTTALGLIDDWLKTPRQQKWNCPVADYAARLRDLVNDPNLLRQGGYPWCIYAASLYLVLKRAADTVVKYALDLYDKGDGAKLGAFVANLDNSTLPAFNAQSVDPMAVSTDWALLAGLCAGTVYSHHIIGPNHYFGGPKAAAGEKADDPDTAKNILKKSFAYATVDVTPVDSSLDIARVRALVTPAWNCDVILIAPLSDYFLGGATAGSDLAPVIGNSHAAPVISLTGDTLTFWSWGSQEISPDSRPGLTGQSAKGNYTKPARLDFLNSPLSVIKGKRYVIRAQLS